ncbi:MAG: hypothetical protein QGG64_16760 [Candidatus Latescibacteria bacterium]|nr:hypothetical protein [Candidatus Latescibacterota bacterium]
MQDRTILRDLTTKYMDLCSDPVQDERRDLWRKLHSLKSTRPVIYARRFAWIEMPGSKCQCEDPLYRQYETFFRRCLFWDTLKDDSIFEPWVTVQAARKCNGWGVEVVRQFPDDPRGAYKFDYPIKDPEDLEKLRAPWHEIDDEKTAQRVSRLEDAIGDLITVHVDRGPGYMNFASDISTHLGHLRGIEHFMMDMVDRPEWLHQLVGFMSAGVLKAHEEAELAGDWGLGNHFNQAMSYAEELEDPAANVNGVARKRLWTFMASQEFTGVSPAMHEEFLLQYQLPILKHFALVAYGCCEDLTTKIDMLRQIPNLRRIAVAPAADVPKCAEQIGQDYVLSYRPSPTDMVGYGLDPDRARAILTRDLTACRDCHVDITLKDAETVQGDPNRVRKWVELTRQVIGEVFR